MAYPADRSALKGEFVIRPRRFAIDASLQFAKRELQAMLMSPRLWAGLAGTSILLGMVGPFGTYDQLPLAARLSYWTAIVVATYISGFAVVHFWVHLFHGETLAGIYGFTLAGAVAGIPVAGLVALINQFAFGEFAVFGVLALLPYCVAAVAVVSGLVTLFSSATPATKTARNDVEMPTRPRILDRLPADKRGTLAYLSMQDHYVDVHTSRGNTLVLMRMADAIAETEGVDGLRIHRSHWIALEAAEGLRRRGGKLVVFMRDGAELPVSRSYSDSVRSAGLG